MKASGKRIDTGTAEAQRVSSSASGSTQKSFGIGEYGTVTIGGIGQPVTITRRQSGKVRTWSYFRS